MEFINISVYILLFAMIVKLEGFSIDKTKEKSCIVETDKGELNLKPLAHSSDPAFSLILEDSGISKTTLLWNPCNDVTPSDCTQQSSGELFRVSYFYGITPPSITCVKQGAKATSKFTTSGSLLSLTYTDDNSNTFAVIFECDKNAHNTSLVPPSSPFASEVHLKGPGACMSPSGPGGGGDGKTGGLSGGSILLIIVSVLLVVYLVAGILIMKFVKKAEGIDLIPNRTFWISIPGYVKDGVLFVVRRGKVSSSNSYDNI